jgi:multiple sugar transport system permease protein
MTLTDSSTGQPSVAAQAVGVEVAGTTPLKRGRVRPLPLIGRIVLWLVLIGVGLLFLYPFLWLLAASLKPRGEVFDNSLIPHTLQLSNYATVWDQLPPVSSRSRARWSPSASRTSGSPAAGCCSGWCSRR